MIASGGSKVWFTAADLADLALPGLPRVKRKVNELASDRRWALKADRAGMALARPRAGRGGGLEYHVSLLPPSAVTELVKRGLFTPCLSSEQTNTPAPDQMWSWYERQPDNVKTEAQRRLAAIDDVETLARAGQTRTAAIAAVASGASVSVATLWNWLALATGVAAGDRLPRLAPRRQGGGCRDEIDPRVWKFFSSDYLRPEEPTFASCYERLKAYAAPLGLEIPHLKTLRRRVESDIDPRVVIAKRKGMDALRAVLPPQTRTVAGMDALELVNIDGHKWDVFVRWPDGHIARPMMVAIQDIMSRKFLAWRVGQSENVQLTRLAFSDVFRRFGIPAGCLLDNGRAFASKAITGGAKTRFRFTIRPEDPTGLLTALGVEIHWATPYRGQSKPIERGFRDLCDHGAKHPAFAGAYTGNTTLAKPDNYGAAAVDLDVFIRVVDRIMAAHNAKLGRRTEMARGGSFDQAFEASYARSAVRRATPEQMRLALLAADRVSTDRKSGSISFCGNRYWAEELSAIAGDAVMVRFDPDNLAADLSVYALDGRFIADVPMIEATGFLDQASAKTRARQEADLRRKTRELVALEELLSADQIAAMLPDDEPEDETVAPNVIRPVRLARTAGAAAAKRAPMIDRLNIEDLATARAPLRLVE